MLLLCRILYMAASLHLSVDRSLMLQCFDIIQCHISELDYMSLATLAWSLGALDPRPGPDLQHAIAEQVP